MRPLEGITVVALEHAIAAPFCTRQLADPGARVIKIGRRDRGDFARDYDGRVLGLSSHFVWTNRSKESWSLDLKDPEDLCGLLKLIGKADVFIQNLAPGATDRLGLSYKCLSEKAPGIIVCDISGYGSDGPLRDRKAYDLLIQAEAGMLTITGSPGSPAKPGIAVADIAAGMYAYSNILAALIERGRTGKGRRIEISMLECMVEWMGYPLYYAFDGAPPPEATGISHSSIYPYGPFPTRDGTEILFAVQNNREWSNFCTHVLRRPDMALDAAFMTNALRFASKETLGPIIVSAFSGRSRAEIAASLDEAGIAYANVNGMHEVWSHPQLLARARWTDVDTPAGRVPCLIPPGIVPDDDHRAGMIPSVGQHNRAIRHELEVECTAR